MHNDCRLNSASQWNKQKIRLEINDARFGGQEIIRNGVAQDSEGHTLEAGSVRSGRIHSLTN
jgi:hypothetical protein